MVEYTIVKREIKRWRLERARAQFYFFYVQFSMRIYVCMCVYIIANCVSTGQIVNAMFCTEIAIKSSQVRVHHRAHTHTFDTREKEERCWECSKTKLIGKILGILRLLFIHTSFLFEMLSTPIDGDAVSATKNCSRTFVLAIKWAQYVRKMCIRAAAVMLSITTHKHSEQAWKRAKCINDMLFWMECHQVVPKVLHYICRNGALFSVPYTLKTSYTLSRCYRTIVNFSRLPSTAYIAYINAMQFYGITNGYSLSHQYTMLYSICPKGEFLYLNRAVQLLLFIAFNVVHSFSSSVAKKK